MERFEAADEAALAVRSHRVHVVQRLLALGVRPELIAMVLPGFPGDAEPAV